MSKTARRREEQLLPAVRKDDHERRFPRQLASDLGGLEGIINCSRSKCEHWNVVEVGIGRSGHGGVGDLSDDHFDEELYSCAE